METLSTELIEAVYRLPKDFLKPTESSVLAYLAFKANPDLICDPTIMEIATATKWSREATMDVIKGLIAKEAIVRTYRRGQHPHSSNIYEINVERIRRVKT